MEEPILIVREFDKTLKFVVFIMHRDTEVGLTSLSASKPSTTTQQSAFDVLMNSSMNTKTILNSRIKRRKILQIFCMKQKDPSMEGLVPL
jgi:hypothetical protein